MNNISQFLGHKGKITVAVNREAYCLGDSIETTITLTVEQDLKVEEVYVELLGAAKYEPVEEGISNYSQIPEYHRERKTLTSKSIIKAGLPHLYEVTFKIPKYVPPTYHGNVISITWLIKAWCDIRMAPDISAELEIPVLSPRPSQVSEKNDNIVAMTTDDCILSLSLSKVAIVEGETVQALLAVKPSSNFTASEIWAEVILFEDIPTAIGYKRKWIEQKLPIMNKPRFERDLAQSFSFDMTIPASYIPTIRIVGFTAEWQLKVIMSRHLHSGYEIIKPFTVYNSETSS
jgi:Arrestin (or S-antigen), C-terminal domain